MFPTSYGSPYHPSRYYAYGPSHPYHLAGARAASPAPPSLEDEEAAAVAHLESIRRRRHEAQAQAAAEARAQQAAEYRQAYLREIQREREQAIRRIQREREAAILAEVERRQQIAAQVEQERRRRQEVLIAVAEQDRRRRAHAAEQQRRQAEFQQALKRKAEFAARAAANNAARCAGRCARKYAEKAREEHKDEFDGINAFLRQFGVNIDFNEVLTAATGAAGETATPAPAPEAPAQAAAPVDQAEKAEVPAPAATEKPVEKEAAPSAEKAAFPEHINDLLSTFLGLRVEPTNASSADIPSAETSTKTVNGVPEGLNEFLGRFGLEFEPLTAEQGQAVASGSGVGAAASSSSTPVPTAQQAEEKKEEITNPLSTFLQGFGATDLPPFVRDILENVDAAFKEDTQAQAAEQKYEGKGKGVAEGEKPVKATFTEAPAAPVPAAEAESASTASTTSTSLAQLDHIATELDLVKESFTFPTTLSFAHSTDAAPSLLFNKTNRPFHEQSNKLLQLLLQADSIASGGDKDVRRKRKALVRNVEKEIEELERRRDAVWEEVKERRANGGESESESESTSSATSVNGDHEHEHEHETERQEDTDAAVDRVPAEVPETKSASYAEIARPQEQHEEPEVVFDAPAEVDGFDVPAEDKPVEQKEEAEVEEKPVESGSKETVKEKEDEFELL